MIVYVGWNKKTSMILKKQKTKTKLKLKLISLMGFQLTS
jgi:hypothetical protein